MYFSVRWGYAQGNHIVRVVCRQLVRKLEVSPCTGGQLPASKDGGPRRGVPACVLEVAIGQHTGQLEGVDVDDAVVGNEKDAVGIELGVR